MRTGPQVSFLVAVNDIVGLDNGDTGEEAEITVAALGDGMLELCGLGVSQRW